MHHSSTSPFRPFPTLETSRLRLRALRYSDLEDIYEYASNPLVSRNVLWDTHRSRGETKDFLDITMNSYKYGDRAPFGIERKDSGKVIGTIDFVHWDRGHANGEIGYTLAPDHWNQGFGSEAAREIIRFGFEDMGLHRIEARCFTENTASAKVMEKVGMVHEGTLRRSLLIQGVRRDVMIYAILKTEWKSY
ncbi:GNAT family N-acetyltransferase [Marinococcus luteus]|uniref:GNAT family N-acetyltransferase n=1 Tax=Marinococcus luteus TaxID=1122204 RepID=UPI002ACCE1BF|nr:GNAT family protein [Marinococcus luteus]MDZ5783282.1 GNAT family protein [Marinococcus luteus]